MSGLEEALGPPVHTTLRWTENLRARGRASLSRDRGGQVASCVAIKPWRRQVFRLPSWPGHESPCTRTEEKKSDMAAQSHRK